MINCLTQIEKTVHNHAIQPHHVRHHHLTKIHTTMQILVYHSLKQSLTGLEKSDFIFRESSTQPKSNFPYSRFHRAMKSGPFVPLFSFHTTPKSTSWRRGMKKNTTSGNQKQDIKIQLSLVFNKRLVGRFRLFGRFSVNWTISVNWRNLRATRRYKMHLQEGMWILDPLFPP